MTIQEQIAAEARRQGVDPRLALTVAARESSFNQSARGSSGEIGVFQLMPGTAADLGVDPTNLEQNIEGGIRYLKQMIGRYGVEGGLMAYNGGPGNVERGTISRAAERYAREVLAAIGFGPAPAPAGVPANYVAMGPQPAAVALRTGTPAWLTQPGGGGETPWLPIAAGAGLLLLVMT